MSWDKVKLGEVTDSCLGKMLDQKKNKGAYKPYLANINVRWGSFDLDNLQEMRFEDDEDERYGIRYGDLIICEGGEPGRCAIWKEPIPNMKIQKALHRVRVNEEMDYRYLYYWFLLAGKQGALKQYYTGATIMHMPGQKLKEVVIDKPPLNVQKRIGNYLEAYDNLIENNQKQIKLLEEAAQRLYKEWFVDLRFPGYEDAEIIDGIPDGWTMTSVGELGEFLRGKTITKKQVVEGNIPVVAGGITPAYYHNKSNTEAPVITVSASGNAGFVNVYTTKIWASDCSYLDIDMSPYFYYILCSMKDRQAEIYTLQHGSAQQHVNANQINALEILKPSDEILKQFVALIKPIYEKIGGLIKQSEVASEARDRLLPKLMSGEIEV